jgi:hypothetical protein
MRRTSFKYLISYCCKKNYLKKKKKKKNTHTINSKFTTKRLFLNKNNSGERYGINGPNRLKYLWTDVAAMAQDRNKNLRVSLWSEIKRFR